MEQEVLRMFDKNYYDVTNWDTGNPYEDIGEVLNSIIADIKKRQSDSDHCGNRPWICIFQYPL